MIRLSFQRREQRGPGVHGHPGTRRNDDYNVAVTPLAHARPAAAIIVIIDSAAPHAS